MRQKFAPLTSTVGPLLTATLMMAMIPASVLAQDHRGRSEGGRSGRSEHSFRGGNSGRSFSGGGRSYSAPAYRGHDYDHGHYRGYYGPSYRDYYAAPYGYYAPSLSFGFGYGYDCVPAGFYDAAGYWHPYAGCASYPPPY